MSRFKLPLFLLLGSVLGCSSAGFDDAGSNDGLTLMPRGDQECNRDDCGDSYDECLDWKMGGEGDHHECKLDCPRGGPTGPIAVRFECNEVHVVSCKELSNVVLAFADGEHSKFDGLEGHYGTFGGGDREIVTVWVKAGSNASGDGPGYGERFDSDADCNGNGGTGGTGGYGGGSGGMDGTGGVSGMGGAGGMDGTGGVSGMDGAGGTGGMACECDCKDRDDDCKYDCDDHDDDCKYDCDDHDDDCDRYDDKSGYHHDDDCDRYDDKSGYHHDDWDDHDDYCEDYCDAYCDRDDHDDECRDGDGYGGGHHCNCDSELECPHGGKIGYIEVEFDCSEARVSSCKDISNVVLELDGGEHRKFDDLDGQCLTLGVADRVILGVWVKAGNNKSGDGPGYGERFDSDADDCDGAGGTGGNGGAGGAGSGGADDDAGPGDDAGTDGGIYVP